MRLFPDALPVSSQILITTSLGGAVYTEALLNPFPLPDLRDVFPAVLLSRAFVFLTAKKGTLNRGRGISRDNFENRFLSQGYLFSLFAAARVYETGV